MSKKKVPQPDFPDIVVMEGNPVDGYSVMTIRASAPRGGRVKYIAEYEGEIELTAEVATKVAATMKSFGDKRGVAIDLELK